MMRVLIPLVLGLVVTACGGEGEAPEATPPPTGAQPPVPPADTVPGEVSAPDSVQVVLEEQDGSGLSGRAELTPEEGATLVVIELDDPEADPTAYLQEGDCTAVRADAAEVLALFLEGRSETTVDEELTNLLNGRFALTLHEDETDDLQSPAACGEIGPEGA
jgi:hypothetical protein